MNSLVESQMTAFQYEERYYGIPLKVDAKLWFYNKDIYKNWGYSRRKLIRNLLSDLKLFSLPVLHQYMMEILIHTQVHII